MISADTDREIGATGTKRSSAKSIAENWLNDLPERFIP